MSRIIGIDYGLKRIGIAVTDPLKMFAQPYDTIFAPDFPDWLAYYTKEEQVDCFVVGMPLRLTGDDTHATQHVIDFIEWLNQHYPSIPVETIDERFSSKEAQTQIHLMGKKKEKRKEKGLIDTVAATIILQTYLQKIS